MSFASINTSGYLAADAETRMAGNTTVTKFRIAANVRKGKEEQTLWFQCDAFGDRWTKVAPYLRKGTFVHISGNLTTHEYSKDGRDRYSLDINVSDLTFGPSKEGKAAKDAGGSDTDFPYGRNEV